MQAPKTPASSSRAAGHALLPDGTDLSADLDLLIRASRGAAEIALRFWGREPKTWQKPGNEGPVTEADLAVDAFLRETLTSARPAYGWMSEETPDDPARRRADVVFIVDPIDGTRAYAKGEKTWAHALAIVVRGVPVAAVVHLPAKEKLYAAAQGQGAICNGLPIQARAAVPVLDRADILVTRPNLARNLWRGDPPGLSRHFRPSLAYRLALVAEGRFDGMITLRNSWDWDVAAGALLLTEAGAAASDRTGAPLRFNAPERQTAGVIAAPEGLHAEILSRLAPGGTVS